VPERPWLGAKLQTLRALALDGLGERAAALDVLSAALAIAEPSGYVRLFLDEGAPLVTLLRAYREQRGAAFSVDAFLAAAGASGSG
jgi:LuxR family transcriptional regulator, maltose regulon positive regulatory protein